MRRTNKEEVIPSPDDVRTPAKFRITRTDVTVYEVHAVDAQHALGLFAAESVTEVNEETRIEVKEVE